MTASTPPASWLVPVENLLSVGLVTADGTPMHVDATTEPKLFWGLRGGRGNFGIATAFEYRLHSCRPTRGAGRGRRPEALQQALFPYLGAL